MRQPTVHVARRKAGKVKMNTRRRLRAVQRAQAEGRRATKLDKKELRRQDRATAKVEAALEGCQDR